MKISNNKLKKFYYPPDSVQELLERAVMLVGYSVGEILCFMNINISNNILCNKGLVGIILEKYLCATGSTKPVRDFNICQIELKTVPINKKGQVLENTFVCFANLVIKKNISWKYSYVKHKLSRILWIPIEGTKDISLQSRLIGFPVLWSPSMIEDHELQNDWNTLMDLIVLGKIHTVNSCYGKYLHLKKKSANNNVKTLCINENGYYIMTTPCAFYLRKQFTSNIIKYYI